jgi:hypothetical protein
VDLFVVKSLPKGRNPTFFTVEVKVGSCDSFKTAIKIMVGGVIGGVRSYILPDSDFGLPDNHRISREIMLEVGDHAPNASLVILAHNIIEDQIDHHNLASVVMPRLKISGIAVCDIKYAYCNTTLQSDSKIFFLD